jgi:L-2-hydroxycarboxylate dehydrogenase (NAD+)
VGRLRRYLNGIKHRIMIPDATPEILRETNSSIALDAKGAMGPPVSAKTMKGIIAKAKENGSAFGCIRNSNHYGIAAYYAMMALEEDMLGISMTNTAALGVPTFSSSVMIGTNPLAFAAPADQEKAFVLDMSTTVVTRGKIEVYDRLSKELPDGWAVYSDGKSAKNPRRLLDDMLIQAGGGILPLGGAGEDFGGYKGYGLAVMVDILCALLSGGDFGPTVMDTEQTSARVCHFFGAIKISAFRDPAIFRKDMDKLLRDLRTCPPYEGCDRVYYAGLKEFEEEERCEKLGIPLMEKVYAELKAIGTEYAVSAPEPVS